MFVCAALLRANAWPSLLAGLTTAEPLNLQIAGLIGIGLVGLGVIAVIVGLAVGALPVRIAEWPAGLPDRDAASLGLAAGGIAAIAVVAAGWFRTPAWAHFPDVQPLGSFVPIVSVILSPVGSLMTQLAVLTTTLAGNHFRGSLLSLRRLGDLALIFALGFAAGGGPSGANLMPWLISSCLLGLTLVVLSFGLLMIDLTMLPLGLGAMEAVLLLARIPSSPFPGARIGDLGGAILILAVSWFWFRALRRGRKRFDLPPAASGVVAA